jgi:hypothetical protein
VFIRPSFFGILGTFVQAPSRGRLSLFSLDGHEWVGVYYKALEQGISLLERDVRAIALLRRRYDVDAMIVHLAFVSSGD